MPIIDKLSLATIVALALGNQACCLYTRSQECLPAEAPTESVKCKLTLTDEEIFQIAHQALQAAWGDSSLEGFREQVIRSGCDYLYVAAWQGTEAIEDIIIPINSEGRITTLPYCCYLNHCPELCTGSSTDGASLPKRRSGIQGFIGEGNLLDSTIEGVEAGSAFRYATSYRYNAAGQLEETDPPDYGTQDVTRFAYDPARGSLIPTTRMDPQIGATTFSYDPWNRRTAITDPNGVRTLNAAALIFLSLWLGNTPSKASVCSPEELSHAKKVFSPTPHLRDYTRACKRIGAPILRLEVDSQGRIAKFDFVRRSGCKPADEKLGQCLGYWRFEPATCKGKPVSDTMTLTINWHPEERDGEDPCRPQEECHETQPKGSAP